MDGFWMGVCVSRLVSRRVDRCCLVSFRRWSAELFLAVGLHFALEELCLWAVAIRGFCVLHHDSFLPLSTDFTVELSSAMPNAFRHTHGKSTKGSEWK